MTYVFGTDMQLDFDMLDGKGTHSRGHGEGRRSEELQLALREGIAPSDELLDLLPQSLRVRRLAAGGHEGTFDCLIFEDPALALARSFEPRLWSYRFPSVVDENNRPLNKVFHLVAVPRMPRDIEVIDISRSEVYWIEDKLPDGTVTKILQPKNPSEIRLALFQDAVAGRTIWRGGGKHFFSDYFCCDGFKDEWDRHGFTGLKFHHCLDETVR